MTDKTLTEAEIKSLQEAKDREAKEKRVKMNEAFQSRNVPDLDCLTDDLKQLVTEADAGVSPVFTKQRIMGRLLKNTEDYITQWNKTNNVPVNEAGVPTSQAGSAIAVWQPQLMSLVKRVMPNLISMEFFGTQPLRTPESVIFAMRRRYTDQTGVEAAYNTVQSGFSGDKVADAGDPSGFSKAIIDTYTGNTAGAEPVVGAGMSLANAQTLGATGGTAWGKMAISIEKQQVSAKSRGLYADYSTELRQDLMSVHGEDADALISEMLVDEIQAEMNREFIRTMNKAAKVGFNGTGIFDITANTDGRWLEERLKGLYFRLELEANAIAKDTYRGKGNRVLCSANVASAFAMSGMLDFTPALAANAGLNVDITGQTFAGVLANGMKVFIDPYAQLDYITVAYKGNSEMDAGIYFAPYTPLTRYDANGEDTFQPRMAFKTRYGIVANPFYMQLANGSAVAGGGLGQAENGYFRKILVKGIVA